MGSVGTGGDKSWLTKVKINVHESEFGIDAGTDVTASPDSEYQAYGQSPELKKSPVGERKIHSHTATTRAQWKICM